jgi:hypothetical protein
MPSHAAATRRAPWGGTSALRSPPDIDGPRDASRVADTDQQGARAHADPHRTTAADQRSHPEPERLARHRKGFTDLGVDRVYGHTATVNTASRRVMEKAGLTLVRTFRYEGPDPIQGSEHGEVEYALAKTGWEARGPAR